jgi:elongation factor G
VPEVRAGFTGAVIGLKGVVTGDTILLSTGTGGRADEWKPTRARAGKSRLELANVAVPQPLFMRAVEATGASGGGSGSVHDRMVAALQLLIVEDPSLSITTDPETGQTLVGAWSFFFFFFFFLSTANNQYSQNSKIEIVIGSSRSGARRTPH